MATIPGNYGSIGRRPAPTQQPQKMRPRFRWWIVYFLLACILVSWAIHTVDPAITWPDILRLFGIEGHARNYSKLAVLCIAMVGFLLIKKILMKRK
jgi:hypothetical protein